MRLHAPPADLRLPHCHPHAPLLHALALARTTLAQREHTLAQALAELGDIDLPPGAPTALDRAQLQAAAPLYFASALESAGVLPAAEQIAGLFASGAVTQPLGPVAQMLNAFWRGRRERLQREERDAIFRRVFEAPQFERLMRVCCTAIVAAADGQDLREDVALGIGVQDLGEFLALRTDAMAAMAAREIVDNLNAALGFLRDRRLQAAFGVDGLWPLVAAAQAGRASGLQAQAERGRAGQSVLLWLAAQPPAAPLQLDPAQAQDVAVMTAAQRWLASLPAAAADTVAAPASVSLLAAA